MIHGYSDHAANERTFLAWVRTGIAVIALGFVVEKFDLFIRMLAGAKLSDVAILPRLQNLSGPLGYYDGIALIVLGIALVILAAVRFLRLERMIADEGTHSMDSVRFELIVSAALLLIVAGTVSYLALD
jgi:putative membrane protein